MYFIMGLLVAQRKVDSILMVVDHFSKMIHLLFAKKLMMTLLPCSLERLFISMGFYILSLQKERSNLLIILEKIINKKLTLI